MQLKMEFVDFLTTQTLSGNLSDDWWQLYKGRSLIFPYNFPPKPTMSISSKLHFCTCRSLRRHVSQKTAFSKKVKIKPLENQLRGALWQQIRSFKKEVIMTHVLVHYTTKIHHGISDFSWHMAPRCICAASDRIFSPRSGLYHRDL